jgi:phage portal protein BeeE
VAVPDAAALDPAGKFNAGALVRATLLDRYTAHKLGIEAGWLLRSEVRELEDRRPSRASTTGHHPK